MTVAFADDLKMLRTVSSLENANLLLENLRIMVGWCVLNDMSLNTEKCLEI